MPVPDYSTRLKNKPNPAGFVKLLKTKRYEKIFCCIRVVDFNGHVPLFAATEPAFPGGEEAMNKYISENLQYPALAKENGVEGIVNVAFTVKSDGSIGSIKIVRMIDPTLNRRPSAL